MGGIGPGGKRRIAVISGHYPGSSFASNDNHRVYCEAHGYTYINCNWPTRAQNAYFNKFEFLKHYYEIFDVLFWIDDDAFFVDFDRSLEDFVPDDDHFLSICSSPNFKAISTEVSSGQFALRCTTIGRRFVDDVLATDLDEVARWWPDDAGFFTRGDQDAVVFLLRARVEYSAGTVIHPYQAFNSRIENLVGDQRHTVFLLHFTGPPERKRRDWRRAQRALRRGPGLVPVERTEGWNLRPPLTPLLRLRRRASRVRARSRRAIGRLRRSAAGTLSRMRRRSRS